jgi:mevalonate kinase
MHYFHEIGLLSRHAETAIQQGDWPELGRLMNLNQLILERIGVSSPELERLNDTALEAGALGAKLAGSGGGGIMIALVTPESAAHVAAAIRTAGGTPISAACAVPGAHVESPG